MNEKDILSVLKEKGEANAPLYRSSLRQALLAKHEAGRFASPFASIIPLVMNKYAFSTVFGVFIFVTLFNMHAFTPQRAEAESLAERAFTRAVEISPEMRAKIETSMKADMLKTLEEARAAKDLKILTPEEYEKQAQFTVSTASGVAFAGALSADQAKQVKIVRAFEAPTNVSTNDVVFTASATAMPVDGQFEQAGTFTVSAAPLAIEGGATWHVAETGTNFTAGAPVNLNFPIPPQPVKYLSYTDPEGHKVVLGLSADDTPVFKIATLTDKDIVKMPNGMIGIQGKAVQMVNVGE